MHKLTQQCPRCRFSSLMIGILNELSHGAENRVVTTDGRAELVVLRLRVTHLVEVRLKTRIEDILSKILPML